MYDWAELLPSTRGLVSYDYLLSDDDAKVTTPTYHIIACYDRLLRLGLKSESPTYQAYY
jgi:hypothetical protein